MKKHQKHHPIQLLVMVIKARLIKLFVYIHQKAFTVFCLYKINDNNIKVLSLLVLCLLE